MAAPTVYLDGVEVNTVCVEEAHLIFDIDALYATGVLVLKDPAGSLYDSIKRGSEILILYEDAASGKPLINHPMRVMNYEKLGSREAATIDRIRAVLISDWYYKQINYTRAFFGTVSQITSRVLEHDKWFSSKLIENSTDSTRIRYQLGQTDAEYLDCIRKYAVAGGSAMYMFTDSRRRFRLLSRKTISNDTPNHRIAPFLDTKENTRGTSSLPTVSAMALSFSSLGANAARAKAYKISARNATEKEQAAANTYMELESKEGEIESDAVVLATPDDIRFSDWTLSPAEAAAIATNKVEREEQELFGAVVVVNNVLATSLDLASVVEVDTNRPCAENGIYFVKHLDLIYNGGQSFTKLMLLRR